MSELPQQLTLALEDVHKDAPGLDSSVSGFLYGAARVALALRYESPASFEVHEPRLEKKHEAQAYWRKPSHRLISSFQEEIERTEKAAECLALAALRARDGLLAYARAEHGSGFDWVLCGPDFDLESGLRLEVTGIQDPVKMGQITSRLRRKVQQIRDGSPNAYDMLPGVAVVVAIGDRIIAIERVDDDLADVVESRRHG